MSQNDPNVVVGEYGNLAVGRFLEKLFPTAIAQCLRRGDVTLVHFDTGNELGSCFGLEADAATWIDAPEYGIFASAAVGRGIGYLGMLIDAGAPSYEVVGSSLVLTNTNSLRHKSNNQHASNRTVAQCHASFSAVFGSDAQLAAALYTAPVEDQIVHYSGANTHAPSLIKFLTMDADLRGRCTQWARLFGEQLATDHPLILTHRGSSAFALDANCTLQAGVEYMVININSQWGGTGRMDHHPFHYPKDSFDERGRLVEAEDGRSWPEDYVAETDVYTFGSTLFNCLQLHIPVMASRNAYHLAYSHASSASSAKATMYLDPRYNTDGTYQDQITPCWPGKSRYFKYAPALDPSSLGEPLAPVLNTEVVKDCQKSLWKSMGRSASGAFLPLIAPPGGLDYHLEMASYTIYDRVEIGSANGHKLYLRRIQGAARNSLYSFPTNWYETYISTGYGIYTPLKGEELSKALEAAEPLAGMTVQVVVPAAPFGVPSDVVTRTDIYKLYKRSREKACKLNDFMQREFVPGIKWQAVHNHFQTLSAGVPAMFGVQAVNPTSQDAIKAPIIDYSQLTINGVVTTDAGTSTLTLTQSGTPAINVDDAGDVAEALQGGAKLTGITTQQLDIKWGGFSVSFGETSATGKEINAGGASSNRGLAAGTLDFSWETLGIGGYPTYNEMPVQNAYKTAIASEMLYKQAGAKLLGAVSSYTLDAMTKIVAAD